MGVFSIDGESDIFVDVSVVRVVCAFVSVFDVVTGGDLVFINLP